MELLKAYLKERRLMLAAFLLFVGVFAVSFALYGLPLAAVGYPAGLCVLLGACLAAWDYGRAARRHKALKRLREAGEAVLLDLPAMTTVEGADCAAVRRFAGEFIDRRIALDYTPVEWETVTDGKWLTFVVEQLLSNALKYTGQDGTVRIYREGDDLCIRDSGMGIAPEDLPRVFDMGYTGQNGRLDRRSSGIGLYLCRRICRNLRHEIRIESVPGVGTTVYLTLGRGDFLPE